VAVVDTWGMRKTLGAVAVAAAVAGVGGAAVAAATQTTFHGGAGDFGGFGDFAGFGGPPGPPPGGRHSAPAEPDALHGEYVVADEHGGFSTILEQTGTITAISPVAVTARSADGFIQSYVIREVQGATTPPFAAGDTVLIKATRQGETAMVTTMGPPLSPGR